MNDIAQIFLELDAESRSALETNGIIVDKELLSAKIDVVSTHPGIIHVEDGDGMRTKDIVTIIVASAALVAAIGYAVSSIISAINYKTHTVVVDGLQEVRDSKGEVLLGPDDKPIFKPTKTVVIVNPAKSVERDFDLTLFKFFKIRILTK